jgi:hypothetical protein
MVEVYYEGNLGNKLFEYCFARIIAESLGYKLKAEPIEGFPGTKERVDGNDYSSYPVQTLIYNELDLQSVLQDKTKRKIEIRGYFQRYQYFKPYKDIIRNKWLMTDIDIEAAIRPEDALVVVRLGSYKKCHSCLPFSYYEEALSSAKARRVFLCSDDPGDAFIRRFKKFDAIIRPTNALDNFKFIMSFNKIIQSQSTFNWWAAFLSSAKEIYTPIPMEGFWHPGNPAYPGIDLTVTDEKRYIYLPCKEKYKETLSEKFINSLRRITNRAPYI